MGLAWGGKYAFERGDVVKVKKPHPWAGRHGIVVSAEGSNQFAVELTPTFIFAIRRLPFWGGSLELVYSEREVNSGSQD